jgi:hydroxyacylglutathione hydrolase
MIAPVIEGNAQMMWNSLQKLMALPKETQVYCGHEYTQSNAKFALTIEPENAALVKRAKEVDQLRAAGKPTLPTNIGIELETNPFLRPSVPAIQQRLGMTGSLRADSRSARGRMGLRRVVRAPAGDSQPWPRPAPCRPTSRSRIF